MSFIAGNEHEKQRESCFNSSLSSPFKPVLLKTMASLLPLGPTGTPEAPASVRPAAPPCQAPGGQGSTVAPLGRCLGATDQPLRSLRGAAAVRTAGGHVKRWCHGAAERREGGPGRPRE